MNVGSSSEEELSDSSEESYSDTESHPNSTVELDDENTQELSIQSCNNSCTKSIDLITISDSNDSRSKGTEEDSMSEQNSQNADTILISDNEETSANTTSECPMPGPTGQQMSGNADLIIISDGEEAKDDTNAQPGPTSQQQSGSPGLINLSNSEDTPGNKQPGDSMPGPSRPNQPQKADSEAAREESNSDKVMSWLDSNPNSGKEEDPWAMEASNILIDHHLAVLSKLNSELALDAFAPVMTSMSSLFNKHKDAARFLSKTNSEFGLSVPESFGEPVACSTPKAHAVPSEGDLSTSSSLPESPQSPSTPAEPESPAKSYKNSDYEGETSGESDGSDSRNTSEDETDESVSEEEPLQKVLKRSSSEIIEQTGGKRPKLVQPRFRKTWRNLMKNFTRTRTLTRRKDWNKYVSRRRHLLEEPAPMPLAKESSDSSE